MARLVGLQVFLCTEDVDSWGAAFDPERIEELTIEDVTIPGGEARLYWRSKPTGPPDWYSFLQAGLHDEIQFMNGSSSVAILMVQAHGRFFAVAFGRGAKAFLLPSRYELDFGFRVTLNRVDNEQLRSVETKSFDDNPLQTLRQAARETDMGLFGLNRSRDLLAAVAGKPRDPGFAAFLAGKDALAWRGYTDIDHLADRCGSFLEAFLSEDYMSDFSWVDLFKRVRGSLLDDLWEILEERLQARDPARISIAPPDMQDWNSSYLYRLKTPKYVSPLDAAPGISDYYFLAPSPLVIDINCLHKDKLIMHDEDGYPVAQWPLWQCMTFETHLDGNLYVLHGGQWYQVAQSLAQEVDQFLTNEVDHHGLELPAAGLTETEGSYNARAAATHGYVLLDKALVRCRDARTDIEACDILSQERHLVHAKCLHGSASLSHLFVQAITSARALKLDPDFRAAVRVKITDRGGDPELMPAGDPGGNWFVVLAIISKPRDPWPTALPFLAKYGLYDCVRDLRAQGYGVAVQQIQRQ